VIKYRLVGYFIFAGQGSAGRLGFAMTHTTGYRRLPHAYDSAQWLLERLEPRTFLSATPAATPADLVAQANNAFAFDLYHQLAANSTGNVFFSPYSADTALEMVLQGANPTFAL